MDFKPHIFIGSSKEGLPIAQAFQAGLSDIAEITTWDVSFESGKSNYENLTSQIALYDYAILVATGDDTIISRKKSQSGARDNVLFEFGLFAGGLGRARALYVLESGIKIPSDLMGITFPRFGKFGEPGHDETVNKCLEEVRKHIINKEKTFDLSFIPSTALAYGYFVNFVEKTVQRLLEDKEEKKVFELISGGSFVIETLKFTILLPNDLRDDMFNKVRAKRLRSGWKKLRVDPKDVRDYDFSVDISKAPEGELHLVDIPLTLNALNMAIDLYSAKQHLGKTIKEELLEYREIRNFKRTLEYLIEKSSLTRGIVSIEIVDI